MVCDIMSWIVDSEPIGLDIKYTYMHRFER